MGQLQQLLCVIALAVCSSIATAAVTPKVVRMPYNNQVYTLAYNSFLGNKEPKNAFLVAEAAVKQQPDDVSWRQRLAEVAIWSEHPDVAFVQWSYLAKKFQDPAALQQALKLGMALNQYEPLAELYLMQLRRNFNDKASWKGYIAVEEARGHPEYAIDLLKTQNRKQPEKFYLQQLSLLYQHMGEEHKELAVLTQLQQRYGVTLNNAMRAAEILYSEGNIKAAYATLLPFARQAAESNNDYWQTIATLAWQLHDVEYARLAYAILYRNQQHTSGDLYNLIKLNTANNPKYALRVAVSGWRSYQQRAFLDYIFALAPNLKEWRLLATTIRSLPATTRREIAYSNSYTSAQTQLLLHTGKINQALALYQTSIKLRPYDTALKAEYLWFLIDQRFKPQLKKALQLWAPLLPQTPELVSPIAAGYSFLGDNKLAVILYSSALQQNRENYDWLINYSDELDAATYPNLATRVRQYAWWRLLTHESALDSMDLRLAYARLAANEAPGDVARSAFAEFNTGVKNQNVNELLMSWALALNNYEQAYYLWQLQRQQHIKTAAWIRQTIALHYNDRDELLKLLEHDLNSLPYRDRVEAAERVGNLPLAQQLAYRGMQEHPNDSRMYQIMQQTFLQRVNHLETGVTYHRDGYALGPELKVTAKLFATPRIYFAPWAEVWRLHTSDSNELLIPHHYWYNAGVKIGRIYRAGEFIFGVGEISGIKTFLNAMAQLSYRWNRKLVTTLMLGLNQPSDDSTALRLAGKQYLLRLDLDYQYTQRDLWHVEAAQHFYYTQDNHYLGNGQTLAGYYEHKFAFSYPDWHIDLFGAVRNYQHAASVSGSALDIVPTTQSADVTFFMPNNAVEYGLLFGFGEALMESYTHAWRPFGQLGVFDNTDSGIGSLFTLGVSGMVFGRDHLVFYLTGSKNHEAAKQLDYILGTAYKLYW